VFLLAAPLVHLAHKNIESAAISLGIRTAAVAVIYRTATCEERLPPPKEESDPGYFPCFTSFALGYLTLMSLPLLAAFDAGVLAKERRRPQTTSTWSLGPVVSRARSGVWLSGSF
jgi:hypothetical protein